ncbi:unnamed protein product [Caenorhabditis sp. 36 PRJEB53466]|nr:unnamed protein product [Caenorhabditis sp. 36 PRJEB53466]
MMYYRRRLLSSRRFSTKKFVFNCIFVYFPSVIVLVFSFLGPTDFSFIRSLLLSSYNKSVNLRDYTLFGFSDITNIFCSSSTLISATHSYIPPFVAMFWRRKIVREINSQQAVLSSRTQAQTRNFVQCLTWQTCLPLFFYVLPYTFYLLQQAFGIGSVLTEYLIFPLNTFSATLDPIFMLYFIKPYQKRAKIIISELFGITMLSNTVSLATVNSQTSQF